jgi:hypothetical protein
MEDDPEPRSFRWILLLKHRIQEILKDSAGDGMLNLVFFWLAGEGPLWAD